MTKQIRFMATNTNQSVLYGNDVRLNCFAQYYSEKVYIYIKIKNNKLKDYLFRQWIHRIYQEFSGFLNDDNCIIMVNI
jgi:hypothetical protein